jgi:pimeloyl-ACP methyl ester carboxylesterase
VSNTENWLQRIGRQRDWVWRGWQTRYAFMRSSHKNDAQPPLILIHGFGASIEHWRNNIPVLSGDRTVYALDLIGFGASRKVDLSYTVDLWVQQLSDFWQTFIGEPVILVGNSIGSLVCMTAAIRHPEWVKGIVMLSLPDVSIRQETIPKWLQPIVMGLEGAIASPWLVKTLFKFIRRPSFVRFWAKIAYYDASAISDELVTILASPAQDEGAAQVFYKLFQSLRMPQFSPAAKVVLPQLNIPILLVWGCQDRAVPFAIAPVIASLNPKIEFVALENVGHCPHDECPEKFNAILLQWLETKFGFSDNLEKVTQEPLKSIVETDC